MTGKIRSFPEEEMKRVPTRINLKIK